MKRKIILFILIIFFLGNFPNVIFAIETSNDIYEDNAESVKKKTTDTDSDMVKRRKNIYSDIQKLKGVKETEKQKYTEKILKNTKEATLKAINSAIKKLNSIKARISKMKVITEEQKVQLEQKIDLRISALKIKIEAVNTSSTKEEVKEALGGSKKELRDTKDIVKEILEAIHKTHLMNVISKIENLISKLEEKSDNLNDEKEESFSKGINDAKQSILNAKNYLYSNELKKAKVEINNARKSLAKIIGNLKGIKDKKTTNIKEEKNNDKNN